MALPQMIANGSHDNEIDMRPNTESQRRPKGTRYSKVHLSEKRCENERGTIRSPQSGRPLSANLSNEVRICSDLRTSANQCCQRAYSMLGCRNRSKGYSRTRPVMQWKHERRLVLAATPEWLGWFCERCCWHIRLDTEPTLVQHSVDAKAKFDAHDCAEFARQNWKGGSEAQ